MLAITGATGKIGGAVARLTAKQKPLLLARDASRLPSDLAKFRVEECEYSQGGPARAHLEGVTTLFMVSAKESPTRLDEHKEFILAASAARVRHIVYTSFLGASPDATFTHARDHFHTEEYIKSLGMNYTFLRDSFYLDFFAEMLESGEIRGPAGTGMVAGVARSDVAACAAAVLREPRKHAGKTYNLTGPKRLSLSEMAEIASAMYGKPIPYIDETLEEAHASRKKYEAPSWEVDAWISTYTAIAAGELDRRTNDVRKLIGRNPVDFASLLASRVVR